MEERPALCRLDATIWWPRSATLREVARRTERGPLTIQLGAALAGLVLAPLVACACSTSAPSAGGASDQSFLAQVHDGAPDVSAYRSDVQLIRLGHAACDGFSAGASYVELADRLELQEGSNPLPPADLGAVISAAARAFCPRYVALVS
jgi:hypothetical protein